MNKKIISGCFVFNSNHQIYLLWRKKHSWFETPGGKIDSEECRDVSHPAVEELKIAALRELKEEVKGIEKISELTYFGKVKFIHPKGKEIIAHKFIVYVEGKLSPNEDIFDEKKSKFFSLSELEGNKNFLSRDLKLMLPKILKKFI